MANQAKIVANRPRILELCTVDLFSATLARVFYVSYESYVDLFSTETALKRLFRGFH